MFSRFARSNILRSSSTTSSGLKAYNVIDHSFDAIVVGAGGSGKYKPYKYINIY